MNNFTQTQVTQKNLQHLPCYFLNLFQEKVWLIQNFLRKYLAYENLPKKYKTQINKLSGTFSSKGPIAITTIERVKEKGKLNKELKANHKLVKTIGKKKSIYFSAGHFIGFNSRQNRKLNELEKYLKKHQIKKKFQFSLEWEKNQLAIWDNRSMLHQQLLLMEIE